MQMMKRIRKQISFCSLRARLSVDKDTRWISYSHARTRPPHLVEFNLQGG